MSIGLTNEQNRKIWLEKVISEIPKGLKILDAGAGELANKRFCEHLSYVSQDFCQYKGEGDSKSLQTGSWDTNKIDIVSDITSIPLDDFSVDAVLCTEVLEHVPDPCMALKELARVLKNDGYLVLTAPFASLTHFSPFHYSTGFNQYFYEYHLKNLGFEIIEIKANGNYYEFMAQETRRLNLIFSKYSGLKLSFLEKKIIRMFLKILTRGNTVEKGSSDILCFGYNVLARKRAI